MILKPHRKRIPCILDRRLLAGDHLGWSLLTTLLLWVGLLPCTGCGSRSGGPGGGANGPVVIRVEGSDTMVNLAQAWAEEYNKSHPEVSVQVSGGGSGVGIASLIEQVTDLANASRDMRAKEYQLAEQNTGKKVQQYTVALDALAIYVHKQNPLETIAIEELAEIYGEEGKITKWSQLGVQNSACQSDEITRVSRQNNSGTYHYFREAVLGSDREFKLGSIDQSGSKDLVALVSSTPCAIGFSGMGYHTEDSKWVKVAQKKGGEGVEPSIAAVKDSSYPLARPLYVYVLGEPSGPIKEYLEWILSPAGQQIVVELGYVPVGDATEETAEQTPAAEPGAEPAVKAAAEEVAGADEPQTAPGSGPSADAAGVANEE
jgi:phosphate transport system substrate-binding protein